MKKLFSIFTVMGGLALPAFAQTEESNWYTTLTAMDSNQLTLLIILGVVLVVIILLLILMVYLMTFIASVFKKENPALANEPSWWESFKERFVTGKLDTVGGKEEKAKLSDHSYDGITELDNFMPPWLQWVFFATIGFGVIYFIDYMVLGTGLTAEEEYQEELRLEAIAAEGRKASLLAFIDETNVVFDVSEAALSSGKTIFESNCAACHAMDGGGGVGPNLTDEYWLHGGSIQNVFKIVKNGVVEKGMIPWQDQLSPEQMQQVSSYILTLKGTTPSNPKAPQGELFSANPAEIAPVADTTAEVATIE